MSDCGVCIGGGDYDGSYEFYEQEIRTARKTHRCIECRREIPVGEKYERVAGKFDGDFFSDCTCMPCAEIAEAFYCDGPRIAHCLWDDMDAVMGDLTTSCFDKLKTPEAKAFLRWRWMKWKGLVA